ncbi:phospholipase D family protein [Orbaceae bacterium ESL0727]|nr:phospholipase D family protein [Orbaceae bacterium ESL0727]
MILFLIIIAIFILASLLSLYSYGRFAKRAKGESSYALPLSPEQTSLDRILHHIVLSHPNQSCLMLIPSNLDAFAIRSLSAQEAGRSLDLQYYIWHDDLTGRLLGLELLKAADRGVRVRILLDDMNIHNSHLLAVMNLHPNIEIRMFNPTRIRNNTLMRGIEMLLRFFSVNRRMHNKLWIVDGRMTIAGGRNIGNEYFGAAENRNFFDIDLLIGGRAVQDATAIFDSFWNSDVVIPIKALIFAKSDALDQLRKRIHAQQASVMASPYLKKVAEIPTIKALFHNQRQSNYQSDNYPPNSHPQNSYQRNSHQEEIHQSNHHQEAHWPLHWSDNVQIISDPPCKAAAQQSSEWLLNTLVPILGQSQQILCIISPYFVPGKRGVAQFAQLRRAGVDMAILTNSLVTNDVLMAHGGYAPYRVPLLKAGIKLYELRPFGKTGKKLIGSSGASLHTKAFLVDDKKGFVGSFNFDPRSANLNCEMGVLFDDVAMVNALQQEFILRSSADFSYRLGLQNNKLYWRGIDSHDQYKIWFKDPASKWWQRLAIKIIAKLPIESQL